MLRIPGQKLNTPCTFPAVMSKSRDYNLIEILFQTLANYFYILSYESKNIHNPKRCPTSFLPLLADYYRYQYTDVENIELERQIISAIPELHHNKGTVKGIENALALSKVDKDKYNTIPWFYDKSTNTVTVIITKGMKTYKMYELLKLVLPLGTKLVFQPGFSFKSSEELKMHSWTEVNVGLLDPDKQWYVTKNNTWKTEWDPEEKLYHTYVDEQAHYDVSRVGNIEVADYNSVVNASDKVKANTEIQIPGEGEK